MTRNLQSSFREGKEGNDFGLRTVSELQQGGRDKGVLAHRCLLPPDDPEGAGCPVPAFGTSSPVLCHKLSSRIRKLNTLAVIIQYLNHLHISLVISA